ncbi:MULTISPECIES: GNAT family N-acetyltransferase [Actinomadura]|uniref:GNAT family N-acetyltransferase n=1 Tax=Actinomadura yumaensis TaxID=111807 RepID=A0ABW2D0Y3_9ACTN|nr:GNAT family N-acetyltransferase [Actinomadura sp. J1-007]MWK35153.1 GNAT family N-acetyltransferase [Actinomadura sp. J1-007]
MGQGRYERHDFADLRAMQELTGRLWSPDGCRWHLGELVWHRLQHPGREPQWRISVWKHAGETVAWAWAQPPGRLDLHVDPAHARVMDEILRWFETVAPRSARVVTVLDTESPLVEALLGHGFRLQRNGPFFVHLRRSLAGDLPEPAVPDGYTLRPVRGEEEAGARAAVHRAAFSRPGEPSEVVTESYLRVMRAWPYRADLDWLVEAPDGTPVSFCLVWLDERNRAAVLEPVGTAPGHRRRGLASAAVLGALRAARALGADHARVAARGDDAYPSARATYQSLGFRPFTRNLSFVRGH